MTVLRAVAYSRSLFHTWVEPSVLRFRLGRFCGLCLGGKVKLRRWLSDWVDDRLGVEGGVINAGLSAIFEIRRSDILQSVYDAGLRVAVVDDQQTGIAGRELLEGVPLTELPFACFRFPPDSSARDLFPNLGAHGFRSTARTSWPKARVLTRWTRTVGSASSGSSYLLMFVFREGAAKEGG